MLRLSTFYVFGNARTSYLRVSAVLKVRQKEERPPPLAVA